MKRNSKAFTMVFVLLLVMVSFVFAQGVEEVSYPAKGIEVNVGYSAGGATDIAARLVAPYMEAKLGQSITILNKPGAGGEIAHSALAKAAANGYYLGYIHAPATISITLSRKAAYQLSDFTIIGNVVYHENLIVVPPTSRFKTIQDVIAEAKSNPGKLTIGNSGAYADDHLASLAFQHTVGVKFEDTMFQGTAPSLVALLGNHIDLVMCNVADIVDKVRQNQLVVLATLGAERNPLFPDAPTMKELGYEVMMGNYTTLAAPAGTPANIVKILRDALAEVANSPEYIKKATDMGLPIRYFSAEETEQIYQQQEQRLKELWIELKLPTT
jgi:tripartite-type tricarboxylate transporter receptor subunit TctC